MFPVQRLGQTLSLSLVYYLLSWLTEYFLKAMFGRSLRRSDQGLLLLIFYMFPVPDPLNKQDQYPARSGGGQKPGNGFYG